MRTPAILFALTALLAQAAFATQLDGPYVLRAEDGQLESLTIESDDTGIHKNAASTRVGAQLSVAAVGSFPAFKVTLRKPAEISPDSITLPAATPLFIVADTHGEFETFAAMLRAQHIVDAKLQWSFARGHLVILGDVFDRGAHQTEILWLLYALEAQAAKAGGGVHLVLGNHEVMTMQGDLRYLNPRYAQTTELLTSANYSSLFDAASLLGQWLRTRPVMFKVNDLLCLHGGVSRALIDRKIAVADINASVRAALNDIPPRSAEERDRAELLFGTSGPLWYRGYFADRGNMVPATSEDIELALAQFGVRTILVGHTIVPAITSLYDGRVIAVNVAPTADADGQKHFEALLVQRGKFFRARLDGTATPL